ncbi:hypothetical protein [Halomonas kalidii]|uniref:SlyX protein n=1 Tax=Halomonas kalidii TaxID=3043293 RepID=A0ABT6VF24_9GAMM|nr:hypothetical protein [Halomonas kalidii]MDI5932592.1 hypothetical protein [Halomonas kalidii]
MIEPQRTISRHQLEERIAYLQVTLAALTAQLESQRQLDKDAGAEAAHSPLDTPPPDPVEIPLPIAAG